MRCTVHVESRLKTLAAGHSFLVDAEKTHDNAETGSDIFENRRKVSAANIGELPCNLSFL